MKRQKFVSNSDGKAHGEDASNGVEGDTVRVSRTKPPLVSEKEDPYLEGIADSMVIAFFLAAAIKLYLYFFPMS